MAGFAHCEGLVPVTVDLTIPPGKQISGGVVGRICRELVDAGGLIDVAREAATLYGENEGVQPVAAEARFVDPARRETASAIYAIEGGAAFTTIPENVRYGVLPKKERTPKYGIVGLILTRKQDHSVEQ